MNGLAVNGRRDPIAGQSGSLLSSSSGEMIDKDDEVMARRNVSARCKGIDIKGEFVGY